MGDILNVAAFHNNGAATATFGIRGNSFQFKKENDDGVSVVSLVNPIEDANLNLKVADIMIPETGLVSEKISTLETYYSEINDQVSEMDSLVTEDFAYLTEEGDILVLDEDGKEFYMMDSWNVRDVTYGISESVANLMAKITELNTKINDLTSSISTINTNIANLSSSVYTKSEIDTMLAHEFLITDAEAEA